MKKTLDFIKRGCRTDHRLGAKELKNARGSGSDGSQDAFINPDGTRLSKNQKRKEERRRSHEARLATNEKKQEEIRKRKEQEDKEAWQHEPNGINQRYGDLPLVQSQERKREQRLDLDAIPSMKAGDTVTFRARIHTIRKMSAKLCFMLFRQQLHTIQGVVAEEEGIVSQHMVKWAESIAPGSIVLVKGIVQSPKEPVKACSIKRHEILVRELHIIANRPASVPFTVYEDDMSRQHELQGENANISDRLRLTNRILDLRTATSQAIFRVNSGVCNIFRSYLDSRGFVEIHTPKLQGGATESGSSVFQLDYFGRPAFLAQSPQLAKQMCIAADFEKVYEIGPVFRAENSNTHRHLTEYTGLDLEMAIEEHYHEALELILATLKSVFEGIYQRYSRELEVIKRHFPHDDLVWLDETPRIPFAEGVQMLRDSGWTDEAGNPPSPNEDLHTRDEIRLGELIKEKYKTDFYVLDKFPASARPFYTMPDPTDSSKTNSFDMFIRGQEILTGGQRIHEPGMLEEHMRAQGVDPDSMEEYMEGFRLGAPPHAGAGIGLERLVMLMLKLENIRLASLFHRDPKSLPAKPPGPNLRHPADSTLKPPWGIRSEAPSEDQMQPLENLIANYGDATNTSWTDDRYMIWRDPQTGAAVSYVIVDRSYAIIPGNPLCDPSQYQRVFTSFLNWLKKETKLHPISVLASSEFEEVLGSRMGWKTFTCAAEQRVDPTKNPAESDREVGRKIRHAEKEGVKIIDLPEGKEPPQEIRQKIDARIDDWLSNRQGKQIHLSEINPWRDWQHRRYFYAQDTNGTICALVVMAQLALDKGYQVKWSLDFPNAPSGTIEYITLHAVKAAAASGAKNLTFGAAATAGLHAGHHLGGVKVKVLSHTYQSIAAQFKLAQKSDFRQKLGASDDPVYICYPPHGLGVKGSKAVVDFFED